MKSDPTGQVEAPGPDTDERVADPFAVDLFAGARADGARQATFAREEAGTGAAFAAGKPWHAALPKVSRSAARLSTALAALPPSLSSDGRKALARALARYTQLTDDDVEVSVVDLREDDSAIHAAPHEAESAPRVIINADIEPEGATVRLVADAEFASAVADLLLGGDGAPASARRALSATERAVIEFLSLCVIHELNALAGEPLFRLDGVSSHPAAAGAAHVAARAWVATARVRMASAVGLVRLILDGAALSALSVVGNPLLARGGERGAQKIARYKQLAGDVALRLPVGETQVDALNLSELETGDVVIVERALIGWRAGRIGGRLRVSAGDGEGVRIEGRVEEAAGDEEAVPLAVAVESISTEGARVEGERLSMEDERQVEAGGAGVLDGLLLTVHVELAARRISLEELSRLRVGQILELGCRATDPVDLIAEGRRIATGELVDVEGRLGVRVTRLTG